MTITLLGPPKTERMVRTAQKGTMRALESEGRPVIRLQVVQYGVVDSYDTVFMPGCMTRSWMLRKPQLTWGHSWSDIIGRAETMISDNPEEGPIVDFYLDDFDAVPRARQAYAQVQSGTIDNCSIGFGWNYEWHKPTDDELKRFPGADQIITQIDWDETALVLRGAVEGANVVGWRSKRSAPLTRSSKFIEEETAAQIVLKLASPDVEFSVADAFNALRESAVDLPEPKAEEDGKEDETETPEKPAETTDSPAEGEDQDKSVATTEAPGGETIPDDTKTETPAPVETPQPTDVPKVPEVDPSPDADVEAALELAGRL